MKIYEIGTGYTSIPAKISAATEIVVEELTKSMLEQKKDVKIIDIEDKNRKETNLPIISVNMPKMFNNVDIALGIKHKLKRVVYSILLAKKIHKILKDENKKVILHFHNQYNLFFFLKLTPKKLREKCYIAYTNHSGIWSCPLNEVRNTLKKRYFQESYSMKKADIVFVFNQNMKNNILEYCNIEKEKLYIVNNGVNEKIYSPLTNEEKIKIKEKLGLSGKKIILQVGSVYENKGQIKSIESLSNIIKPNPQIMYIFVGGIVSQEYFNEILKKSKELGIENNVKYLGMIKPGKELCDLYNSSEYTILASEYEAFAMVGIESMACGTPVLIHQTSNLNFGPGSIKLNENNINTIFDRDLKNIRENARKNVLDNYTWSVVTKTYLDKFKEFEK